MNSGCPRLTLAGSGTVVHAHHQRAFAATSRGPPAWASRPEPLALPWSCAPTCAQTSNSAKHPLSGTAVTRLITVLPRGIGEVPESLRAYYSPRKDRLRVGEMALE